MQRNIVNEVIVALLVIVMLLSGTVFATLMSIISSNAAETTPTVIAEQAISQTPQHTATQTTPALLTQTQTTTPTTTASNTPAATATASPTLTLSATHTATATASLTPTITPSATHTPDVIATRIAASATAACPVPDGWQVYTVERGDSWLVLGSAVGRDAEALASANCSTTSTTLLRGTIIYLPTLPTSTTADLLRVRCDNPSAQIVQPLPLRQLSGQVRILGVASAGDFTSYRIRLLEAASGNVIRTLAASTQAVAYGQLAEFDADTLAAGAYRLRLFVERANNPTVTCDIPVLID